MDPKWRCNFLFNMVIFQPAMLVYQRVSSSNPPKNISLPSSSTWAVHSLQPNTQLGRWKVGISPTWAFPLLVALAGDPDFLTKSWFRKKHGKQRTHCFFMFFCCLGIVVVLFNQADVLVFSVVCVERRAFMPFCSLGWNWVGLWSVVSGAALQLLVPKIAWLFFF